LVDSLTKTPLRRVDVEDIVEVAFGGAVSLRAMTACEDGWFNAVHLLELDDGTDCVLKVAPPPHVRVQRYEHDLITTEVDALRLVGDATDLPVPAVLAFNDSGEVVPSPWFVMARCPGVLLSGLRPTLSADEQLHIDAQLARHLATMNAIVAPAFGRPDPTATHDRSWAAAFARLIDDLLADATDAAVELPLPPTGFGDIVAQHQPHLDRVTSPRLVHWDLFDPNVFVDPGTHEVVGLIDFERVLWADPLMEGQFLGKRANDPIVEAYGEPLFDRPGALERRRLYDLYLYLVMTIECAYRNYPTDDIEQFARPMLDATLAEIRAG
jgi:aminoglycoside phosphotransferase (APT) family kinase protein